MSYFTAAQQQAIIADPTQIVTQWARDGARFRASLGPGFSAEIAEHIQLGFCAMVAHDLKPYISCSTVDLTAMLNAPGLVCDNYVALAWRLFNILVPAQTTTVAALGWNGGAVGNHCQLYCIKTPDKHGNGGGYWLIDPTVGVFQCGYNFDGICSGKPASSTYRADLYQRAGSVTDLLHAEVIAALAQGLYRPSSLLYYFEDIDLFSNPPPEEVWPTPQAAALAR